VAINDLGYSTSEVGRALYINRENAGRCAVRGKVALLCRETTSVDMIRRRFLDGVGSLFGSRVLGSIPDQVRDKLSLFPHECSYRFQG
jgi:hypothetical protein